MKTILRIACPGYLTQIIESETPINIPQVGSHVAVNHIPGRRKVDSVTYDYTMVDELHVRVEIQP